MPATLTPFLLLLKRNKAAHNGSCRKGGWWAAPAAGASNMAPLSHTYQLVSSGLCAPKMKRLCRSSVCQLEVGRKRATRRWMQGARRGGAWWERLFVSLHLVTPISEAWMWNPICAILLPIIMLHWGSEMVSGWWAQREGPLFFPSSVLRSCC